MLLIGPVDEEAHNHDLEELVGVVNILGVVAGVSIVNVSMVVGRVVEVSVLVSVPVTCQSLNQEIAMLEEAAQQISLTGEYNICFFLERLVRPHPMEKCEGGRTSTKNMLDLAGNPQCCTSSRHSC